jgi:signal transduction histidine kinase
MRAAGVRVNVETVGDPRQLSAVIDITGYRIVQESLTNVLKHSVDKLATVRLEYQSDALLITVTNPAAPVSSIGTGRVGTCSRTPPLPNSSRRSDSWPTETRCYRHR